MSSSWSRLIVGTSALVLVAVVPCHATDQYVFLKEWGSRDVTPGNFNFTRCLAVDRSSNVYVTDGLNNRVQKFSSMGMFSTLWGTAGAGPGQFNDPWGVAVDTAGSVYVVDFANNRVQKFTSSGSYLTQWGHEGTGNGEFKDPRGIAVDNFGYTYTAEDSARDLSGLYGNHRIQRFTNTGGYIAQWPGLSDPQDVAVDRQGNIFVADGNVITKYASTGTLLARWGSPGSGPGQFNWPTGLGVDRAGYVYVAEYLNHRIQKFTNAGTFVTQWGSFGSGPGQFNNPSDVAVDDSGNVYVSDVRNFRIQKFGPTTLPILLIHGICGSASSWDPFAQVLNDSGFVVERFEYGSPEYSLRPASYVGALAAKLDAIPYARVAVVAHSMGGLIAREYMRRQLASGRRNKISQLVNSRNAPSRQRPPGEDSRLGPCGGQANQPCLRVLPQQLPLEARAPGYGPRRVVPQPTQLRHGDITL